MKRIEEQQPLSEYSTFGIGGPARFFTTASSVDEMAEAFRFAEEQKLPFLVIGKGSNSLFDDRGYEGVVILNKINTFKEEEPGLYYVGAGYSFSRLGAKLAREGWSGLEFASGIPGTVGGAIFMNAGANGQETCDTLEAVDFMQPNGRRETLTVLHFAYRTSSFQQMRGAILGGWFRLSQSEDAREFQRQLVEYRTATQPYDKKSAGCVFRNPEGGSAGRLIEESGLKSLRHGGAEVSPMHANFIVNSEQATAADVLALAEEVAEKVWQEKGVRLERELRFIPMEGER